MGSSTLIDPRVPDVKRDLDLAIRRWDDDDRLLARFIVGMPIYITMNVLVGVFLDSTLLVISLLLGIWIATGLACIIVAGIEPGIQRRRRRIAHEHRSKGHVIDLPDELRARWKAALKRLAAESGRVSLLDEPPFSMERHFDLVVAQLAYTDAIGKADRERKARLRTRIEDNILDGLRPVLAQIEADARSQSDAAELERKTHQDYVDLLLGDKPELPA